MDIIFGIHSIKEALKNPLRAPCKLYCAQKARSQFKEFEKASLEWIECSPHSLQEEARALCQQRDFTPQRVPSQAFLLASPLPAKNLGNLYSALEAATQENPCRLLLLDGVTDVHNVAAILRSAAFYNVHAVILSRKGGVCASPQFLRVASGAAEHVDLINVASLPKTIQNLSQRGVALVGLSEGESADLAPAFGLPSPARHLGPGAGRRAQRPFLRSQKATRTLLRPRSPRPHGRPQRLRGGSGFYAKDFLRLTPKATRARALPCLYAPIPLKISLVSYVELA